MLRDSWSRLLWVLGGAIAASLLLAACGGDSEDEAPSPPPGVEIVTFTLEVDDFEDGGEIPVRYTCDGEDESPELSWSDVPDGAQALALIVDDPDAGGFTHWLAYDFPAEDADVGGSAQGVNDFGDVGYGGPCPPPNGFHRYQFTLYALDSAVDLGPGVSKDELLSAMDGHVIGRAELVGTYER